jgi:16S rRNA G966 N2-methylase RsmD
VVFVETDPGHARLLRRNTAMLEGVAEFDVLRMDARHAPRRLHGRGDRFDLVFLDPPYSKGLAVQLLEALGVDDGVLEEGAVVVVETASKDALPAQVGLLHRDDERRYGATTLSFYRGDSSMGEA